MNDLKRIWQYSAGYKTCMVMLFLCACLGAWLQILIPQLMAEVLDAVSFSKELSVIARYCLRMGALSLVLVLQGIGKGYFVSRWSAGLARNLADELFTRTLSFESRQMDHFGSATVLTRLTTDIGSIRRSMQMVSSLLECPLLMAFSVAAAFQIHKGLSLIFVLGVMVFAILLTWIVGSSRRHTKRMLVHYDRMNQMLSENIRGLRTVKSFAREPEQRAKFAQMADDVRRESRAAEAMAALNNPFSKMVINLSVLALVWLGGIQVILRRLSVGELFCLISYTNQILVQVLILSMIMVPLMTSQVSLGRILETLDHEEGKAREKVKREEKIKLKEKAEIKEKQEIKEETEIKEKETEPPPVPSPASVCFEKVSFSYGEGDEESPLLKDISFELPGGSVFGITGPSGCGKTTLLKLLMGLYSPTQGRVRIGGRDVQETPGEELRQAFGYVPQRVQFFSGTVEENLRSGLSSLSRERMEAACRDACILEFISSQPEGFGMKLKEEGGNLSGGQRQRLSLARALVREGKILVLDNVTSALDRITEERVIENLQRNYPDKTRILVSDRISTIRRAEKILVLDRGEVAGLGTHEELLRGCPIYREMDRSQRRRVDNV